MLDLRDRIGDSFPDRITVETYGPGYEIVKEMNPKTPYQAQFSLAYCVSAAFIEGAVGLSQFTPDRFTPEGRRKSDILAFMPQIRGVVADDLTAKYPAAWPTRIAVELVNGKTLRGAADFPRGNPENPVTTEELETKFGRLVAPRFGSDVARSAIAWVNGIETCKNIATEFADPIATALRTAVKRDVIEVESYG
jgi:2-methylcitrate dehydratase PrpD